jgi:hypothetical protein
MAISDRYQLFCPVCKHADDDDRTETRFFESDPKVNPVGEDVDIGRRRQDGPNESQQ